MLNLGRPDEKGTDIIRTLTISKGVHIVDIHGGWRKMYAMC